MPGPYSQPPTAEKRGEATDTNDALAASINRYRQGRPTATGEPAPSKLITGKDAQRERETMKHIAHMEIQIRDKLNSIRHG